MCICANDDRLIQCLPPPVSKFLAPPLKSNLNHNHMTKQHAVIQLNIVTCPPMKFVQYKVIASFSLFFVVIALCPNRAAASSNMQQEESRGS